MLTAYKNKYGEDKNAYIPFILERIDQELKTKAISYIPTYEICDDTDVQPFVDVLYNLIQQYDPEYEQNLEFQRKNMEYNNTTNAATNSNLTRILTDMPGLNRYKACIEKKLKEIIDIAYKHQDKIITIDTVTYTTTTYTTKETSRLGNMLEYSTKQYQYTPKDFEKDMASGAEQADIDLKTYKEWVQSIYAKRMMLTPDIIVTRLESNKDTLEDKLQLLTEKFLASTAIQTYEVYKSNDFYYDYTQISEKGTQIQYNSEQKAFGQALITYEPILKYATEEQLKFLEVLHDNTVAAPIESAKTALASLKELLKAMGNTDVRLITDLRPLPSSKISKKPITDLTSGQKMLQAMQLMYRADERHKDGDLPLEYYVPFLLTQDFSETEKYKRKDPCIEYIKKYSEQIKDYKSLEIFCMALYVLLTKNLDYITEGKNHTFISYIRTITNNIKPEDSTYTSETDIRSRLTDAGERSPAPAIPLMPDTENIDLTQWMKNETLKADVKNVFDREIKDIKDKLTKLYNEEIEVKRAFEKLTTQALDELSKFSKSTLKELTTFLESPKTNTFDLSKLKEATKEAINKIDELSEAKIDEHECFEGISHLKDKIKECLQAPDKIYQEISGIIEDFKKTGDTEKPQPAKAPARNTPDPKRAGEPNTGDTEKPQPAKIPVQTVPQSKEPAKATARNTPDPNRAGKYGEKTAQEIEAFSVAEMINYYQMRYHREQETLNIYQKLTDYSNVLNHATKDELKCLTDPSKALQGLDALLKQMRQTPPGDMRQILENCRQMPNAAYNLVYYVPYLLNHASEELKKEVIGYAKEHDAIIPKLLNYKGLTSFTELRYFAFDVKSFAVKIYTLLTCEESKKKEIRDKIKKNIELWKTEEQGIEGAQEKPATSEAIEKQYEDRISIAKNQCENETRQAEHQCTNETRQAEHQCTNKTRRAEHQCTNKTRQAEHQYTTKARQAERQCENEIKQSRKSEQSAELHESIKLAKENQRDESIATLEKELAESKAILQKELAESKAILQKELAESKATLEKELAESKATSKKKRDDCILKLQETLEEHLLNLKKECTLSLATLEQNKAKTISDLTSA